MNPGAPLRLAGLVLAAGASTRMGPDRNKLLEGIDGRALVLWPIEALRRAGVREVFVVTGFEADRVREVVEAAALDSEDAGTSPARIHLVPNTEWQEGMGGSIAAGARAVMNAGKDAGAPFDAVLVCVGDLPDLRAEVVEALVAAYQGVSADADADAAADAAPPARAEARICVPFRDGGDGRDGHPVLFGSAHFPALAALVGDRGARRILAAHAGDIVRVPVATDGILRDVDTPEELEAARRSR